MNAPRKSRSPKAPPQEDRNAKALRALYGVLQFWTACPDRRCRRVHDCRGDLRACQERQWDPLPQETKSWIYDYIRALHAGQTRDEAARTAGEKRARAAACNADLGRP